MNEYSIPTARYNLSLIEQLRYYRRITFFSIWLTISIFIWLCISFLIAPFKKLHIPTNEFFKKNIAKVVLIIFNVDCKVTGKIPKRPFFLISNHLSYLDIVVLSAILGGKYVAKKEVQSWPVFGFIAKQWGSLFIDRNQKKDLHRIVYLISESITNQSSIIIFPEGTSSAGQQVLPFYSSLLTWPAANNFPVHYACVSYATKSKKFTAAESICWWGDMAFLPHLKLMLSLPNISTQVTFGSEPIIEANRKILAKKLSNAVTAQFVPSR